MPWHNKPRARVALARRIRKPGFAASVWISHTVNGEVVFHRAVPVAVFWRLVDTLRARSARWAVGHHQVQFEVFIPGRLYRERWGA